MHLLLEMHRIDPTVLVLTILIGVVGLIMVIIAAILIPKTTSWHDIGRDLGIAFLIAAIVSTMYELNTRSILDVDRLEGVLQTVLASNIPLKGWDQVNKEILQREVIRSNMNVTMSVQGAPKLPDYQKIVKVNVAYDLSGLSANKIKYVLNNELGSYPWGNAAVSAPRFERVTVGTHPYSPDDLAKIVKEGKLTIPDIEIGPKGAAPVHIEVVRSELIAIPGNYHLAMTELTDGLRLHLDIPQELKSNVRLWSNKGHATLTSAGPMWYFDGIIFPGQEVSLQLWK